MTAERAQSWAAQGLGSAFAAIAPQRTDEPGLDVFEVRIVADHDVPGGLVVMVMVLDGPPIMSWTVPPQFLGELLDRPGSNAIVRCRRPGSSSLATPPGEPPSFLRGLPVVEGGPGEVVECG